MPWSKNESAQLFQLVQQQDSCNQRSWIRIAEQIKTKTARQCYDYYLSHSTNEEADKYHKWSTEEEQKLLKLKEQCGSNWKLLKQEFSSLSLNQLKNKYRDLTEKKQRPHKASDFVKSSDSTSILQKSLPPPQVQYQPQPQMQPFFAPYPQQVPQMNFYQYNPGFLPQQVPFQNQLFLQPFVYGQSAQIQMDTFKNALEQIQTQNVKQMQEKIRQINITPAILLPLVENKSCCQVQTEDKKPKFQNITHTEGNEDMEDIADMENSFLDFW
ncbi:Myb-like_DNA-binding domain-containing protein [Hexamita inflata]|uniref:Myb-like DNA-binding domain-containing protein n=1 Tax=Hexamita inflata TaxID=28002 RepID=A0AA86UC60_9EUKA|nr:Myb-like DNA-binding domain-containing protein [Hexamita inflata]